jgi:hypothetical protein
VSAATLMLFLVLTVPPGLSAQRVFHSTQSANLPTTETLRGGNLLFEISHRFSPPISEGADALWGLDGPVYNRLGLSFAPTDRVLLGVIRSNLDDNLEFNAKGRFYEGARGASRFAIAAMGGAAWNMDVVPVDGATDNEFQGYVQLIADVLALDERVAVGLAPAWIHNPRLRDTDTLSAVAVGLHGQWYLTDAMSLLGEWIFSEEIADTPYDSGTFGIELETRGHFFKIVVTNQDRMQPTQFLAGSQHAFTWDELRLGFNLTRVLPF